LGASCEKVWKLLARGKDGSRRERKGLGCGEEKRGGCAPGRGKPPPKGASLPEGSSWRGNAACEKIEGEGGGLGIDSNTGRRAAGREKRSSLRQKRVVTAQTGQKSAQGERPDGEHVEGETVGKSKLWENTESRAWRVARLIGVNHLSLRGK